MATTLTLDATGGLFIPPEVTESVHLSNVRALPLSLPELIAAFKETRSRGVRGGAIYDYLHLVSARRENASRIYTLNVSHFKAFHWPGDPEIVHP